MTISSLTFQTAYARQQRGIFVALTASARLHWFRSALHNLVRHFFPSSSQSTLTNPTKHKINQFQSKAKADDTAPAVTTTSTTYQSLNQFIASKGELVVCMPETNEER